MTKNTTKAATKTTATTTATEFDFFSAYRAAMVARAAEVPSEGINKAIASLDNKSKVAINAVFENDSDFNQHAKELIRNTRIAVKANDKENYIAVKALVKINEVLNSIGQGLLKIDGYTKTIIENLIASNSINQKTMLVALSRSVVFDELEATAVLVARHNCGAATASTQTSSTRMMLHYLNICNVVKGARNDVVTFKDNECAANFMSLFLANAVSK